mgnify:CR=1 FL=1
MLEIKEVSIEVFKKDLLNDYKTLFPKNEQRDWKSISRTYTNNIEKFYVIMNGLKTIGFIMLEKLENKPYYIDYFAIKKEYQNQGYGTKAIRILLNEIIKNDGVCMEIEKENMDNPYTIKRASFYKSLNFIEVNSTYNLYNVLYTPYYWNAVKKYTEQEIAEILFNYYEINCGKKQIKKNCKILK